MTTERTKRIDEIERLAKGDLEGKISSDILKEFGWYPLAIKHEDMRYPERRWFHPDFWPEPPESDGATFSDAIIGQMQAHVLELCALARQPLPFHGPEDKPEFGRAIVIVTQYDAIIPRCDFYRDNPVLGECNYFRDQYKDSLPDDAIKGWMYESDLLYLFQQQFQHQTIENK